MQTIEALKRRVKVAQDLHSVVKTMKVLAAASIRQYEEAVRSLGDYYRTIERALQVLLRDHPGPLTVTQNMTGEHVGVVVFGSGQGLCGRFNEQIAEFAAKTLNGVQARTLAVLTLGEHVVGPIEQQGYLVGQVLPVPSSIAGLTPTVQDLLLHIEAWRTEESVDRVLIFFTQPRSSTTSVPRMQQLIPLDPTWLQHLRRQPWPTRVLPTYTMDWNRLFSTVLSQYFFVSCYRALAESLASEQASRLTAMQSAEKNIGDRLEKLQSQYRRQRQHEITEEILDVIAGFEAATASERTSCEEAPE